MTRPKRFDFNARHAAVLALLLPGFAVPAAAQVSWQVRDLGVLDTPRPLYIADTGRVAGSASVLHTGSSTRTKAFFIDPDGQRTDLTPLVAGGYSEVGAINNSGAVAVTYSDGSGRNVAVASWSTGGPIANVPAGATATALAINAQGELGGIYSDSQGCSAALWGATGSMTRLPGCGYVNGLNRAGQAVGSIDDQAFLWQSGALTQLSAAGASGGAAAQAINDSGVAVGWLQDDNGSQAMLWNAGQALRLASGRASAINNAGQVLGSGANCGGGSSGFLWSASGGLRCISELSNAAAGFQADSLNAAGQIAGLSGGHGIVLSPQGTMRWQGADGGSFIDAASWDSGFGLAPSRFLDLVLAPEAVTGVQTVLMPGRFVEARSLQVGGNGGAATLSLQPGAQVVTTQGTRLAAGSVLVGDGTFVGGLANEGLIRLGSLQVAGGLVNRGSVVLAGTTATLQADLQNDGSIAVASGQTLTLQRGPKFVVQPGLGMTPDLSGNTGGGGGAGGGTGGPDDGHVFIPDAAVVHRNAGSLTVAGQGRVQVQGALRQEAAGRLQLATASSASFADGLLNAGVVSSAGSVRLEGRIRNLAGGRIESVGSAGAGAPGTRTQILTLAADLTNEGLVVADATLVSYQGWVDGTGSFESGPRRGDHLFQGTLAPGLGIGTMTISNGRIAGSVLMDLGAAQADHIVFSGALRLETSARLRLQFASEYLGRLEDHWDLFDYEGLSSPLAGGFTSVELPVLQAGLHWDLSQIYSSGVVSIAGVPVGMPPPMPLPVPEPASWALMLAGAGWLAGRAAAANRRPAQAS